jgi:hypothetical protein
MITVMLDNDITGFRDLLDGSFHATAWDDYIAVSFVTMKQAGLDQDSKDRVVWRFCQSNGFILLTGNRNNDDDDSLAQTLLEENAEDSLPVITVSDKDRLHETAYRENCIHSLVGILIELDNYLGTARQYIP